MSTPDPSPASSGPLPWEDAVAASPDIRLVVVDMDGTLLDGDKRIPDPFWPLLDRLSAAGVDFAPASGRQLRTLSDDFPDPDRMSFIAENGNLVVRDGGVVSATSLAREPVDLAIELVRDANTRGHDLGLVVCGRDRAYMERSDAPFETQAGTYYHERTVVPDLHDVDAQVLKLAVYDFEDAETSAYHVLAPLTASCSVVISGAHWVDVMDPAVDKGVAVRILQNHLGITSAQTAVFGDYLNDLEMLGTADYSFAMANAHPTVLGAARYRAPANTEAGVVTVVEALLDAR